MRGNDLSAPLQIQSHAGMIADAASAGFYESATSQKFSRLVLLTNEGLLHHRQCVQHQTRRWNEISKRRRPIARRPSKDLIEDLPVIFLTELFYHANSDETHPSNFCREPAYDWLW